MSPPRRWRRVFRLDVGREHVGRDVDEEIAFHLAMRAERLRRQGLDRDAAKGATVSAICAPFGKTW
jgi:hypothetical protein